MNTTTWTEMNPPDSQLWGLIGGAAGAVVAAFVMLRKYLSRDAVDRAGDAADIGAIKRLNDLLDEERKARREAETRADMFAKERNEAIMQIGELKGQIAALTMQVALLNSKVEQYANPQAAAPQEQS
ncbi:hypothetical protein F1_00012 [Ralstonia phage Heva]|uniref:Chemotaxis protein n=5 Tax=Caudoviricetes TaxID=2731619 RepID=A0A7G5BAQ3_9CAUD|nr:hol-like chemotaxis [Ralstonia phage Cimandef]YP_010078376.1 hol-like chemotaxis [Ralstonia phage Gamede]YP_010078483.1 hol-like chemotaxis [Ralstonia phage Heva]YP_010078658.1 hol-like chemotaxis [Ralstonia phage Claudette]QMV32464.1 hypothetical protein 20A_00014 [Ralstonia phage Alix]QMV32881.1 hypothetical protein D1_00055 [Ralstonia phage Dimitile]QMV32641.1 hypothetical protein B2_00006 [Ralstonia phage Cimandef]QMV33376.1 hypothetical protein F1_00012 [Ralstonia phage Heva]QOQ3781